MMNFSLIEKKKYHLSKFNPIQKFLKKNRKKNCFLVKRTSSPIPSDQNLISQPPNKEFVTPNPFNIQSLQIPAAQKIYQTKTQIVYQTTSQKINKHSNLTNPSCRNSRKNRKQKSFVEVLIQTNNHGAPVLRRSPTAFSLPDSEPSIWSFQASAKFIAPDLPLRSATTCWTSWRSPPLPVSLTVRFSATLIAFISKI